MTSTSTPESVTAPVTESTPESPSSVRATWLGPLPAGAWRTPQHWVRLVVGGVPMLFIGAWVGSHILS